jgi:hypothetical protein
MRLCVMPAQHVRVCDAPPDAFGMQGYGWDDTCCIKGSNPGTYVPGARKK